ncbi:MAG: hypothetical protein Fur005_47090 [Roseiflexaceae bacterium]
MLLISLSMISQTFANGPFLGDLSALGTSFPALADLDDDGDLDCLVLAMQVSYYRNIGSAIQPVFQKVSTGSPFAALSLAAGSAPSLGDINGDGRIDLVVGRSDGTLRAYLNTGSATAPSFSGSGSPIASDVGSSATPALGDLDGDGDLDLVVGNSNGTLSYFTNSAGSFSSGPSLFASADVGDNSAPAFGDVDGDGDLDLVVGESMASSGNPKDKGRIDLFLNTGSVSSPSFGAAEPEATNTLKLVEGLISSAPVLGDLDDDNDLDALVGSTSDTVQIFLNDGTPQSGAFYNLNPMRSEQQGANSMPAIVDIDGDGDHDLFFGVSDGRMAYYENKGTTTDPVLREEYGKNISCDVPGDSCQLRDFGSFAAPDFGDLNGDGKPDDIVIASGQSSIFTFFNTGTFTAPIFTEQTGSSNPFAAITLSGRTIGRLIDLDGDGDLDLVLGLESGLVSFFRNTGSATAPVFAASATSSNLFGFDVGSRATPTFGDIDADGDYDAYVGAADGSIHFFRNTGSSSAPTWLHETDTLAAIGMSVAGDSAPLLVDLDGDNDLDLLNGSARGTFTYYENQAAPRAPVDLQVRENSLGGIDVSWADQSHNEIGFRLERSSDNGDTWVTIANLPANTTTHTDYQVTSGTVYIYRVLAVNTPIVSRPSNTDSAIGLYMGYLPAVMHP